MSWQRELKTRAGILWLLKMLGTTSGIAAFFYAYFWVMRHPLSAVTVMPLTWIDGLVAFFPQSLFVYASLWIYIGLGTSFAKDLRELLAFGAASLAMTVVGLAVFVAAPTKVPDIPIDLVQYPLLAFLKEVDVSGNACPSLHAAFAVFTAFVLHRLLTEIRAARALLAGNALWCLGIVYSAMATRQHVALDVIAGAALAGVAWVVYARACAAASRPRRAPDL